MFPTLKVSWSALLDKGYTNTVVPGLGAVSYVRYTPSSGDGTKQRIIKMIEVVEDPLEPPKFKGKKIPRGPPSPPPPVLRSPPRKVTAQEQKDWMIPPCVSNWKVHQSNFNVRPVNTALTHSNENRTTRVTRFPLTNVLLLMGEVFKMFVGTHSSSCVLR